MELLYIFLAILFLIIFFRFFVGLLRVVIKLAIIALVIYFIYQGFLYFT
ncbi:MULTISPECIES: hypothetical protein [Mammaliicoccus]|nr:MULTISPECIES: hypothetical protein [Mammaliicoccus]MBO3077321.1 hypothetical protein [Mammaliicoccus vitulinus]QQT16447.1 hypothetical protein I6J10_05755 [Mammaliicoccus vitulinus]QQY20557.1 hypothetical protein I6J11_06035 [Mammaliicoccus vitulinus]